MGLLPVEFLPSHVASWVEQTVLKLQFFSEPVLPARLFSERVVVEGYVTPKRRRVRSTVGVSAENRSVEVKRLEPSRWT